MNFADTSGVIAKKAASSAKPVSGHASTISAISNTDASSASVYGAGTVFREERVHEAPLNVYAYSKCLFDQYVRRMLADRTAQIAGFRYFNVYGMREQHKKRMASVAWHFFNQYRTDHRVNLTVHNLPARLDGQLDDIIDALATDEQARELQGVQ